MKYKTLHLNLTKKWFDMILLGLKLEEYREIKKYWVDRICENRKGIEDLLITDTEYRELLDIKKIDTATFSNGFAKKRLQFVIEIKNITIREGREEWGAEKGKKYFVIELGKILPTKNISNEIK